MMAKRDPRYSARYEKVRRTAGAAVRPSSEVIEELDLRDDWEVCLEKNVALCKSCCCIHPLKRMTCVDGRHIWHACRECATELDPAELREAEREFALQEKWRGRSICKAAQKSYKTKGKVVKQANSLGDVRAEIAKKTKELERGLVWATEEARRGDGFTSAMWKACAENIGGTPEEQERFFQAAVARFPTVYWLDGCATPCVKNVKIHFQVKPHSKPVVRMPIPLSPYDNIRVEYHLKEWCKLGKLRKIDTARETLPEWATPVFVVDQDTKGLLGRMVCAYGHVNACLEQSAFPAADPQLAYDIAAFKSNHSLVDAIWGYTQFLLDEETQRVLTVCHQSGLYLMLRMPFGPSPAPAEMQSCVAKVFGSLRDRNGRQFCTPLMDDLAVSSCSLEEHIHHMEVLAEAAQKEGFEFKLTKGQFNQPEIQIWGCVCSAEGRKPAPKKV